MFENLYVSQEARAFLENLQASRRREKASKTLSQVVIEEKLDTIIRIKGDGALNVLRNSAREISKHLHLEKEFIKLDRILSAMLATGNSKTLQSKISKARVSGEPFDPGRIDLFENLYNELTEEIYPDLVDQNNTKKAYKSFAFFESYFSNYIEETEFTVSEAKEIITTETPMPLRNEDSYDILGNYQVVSDKNEMTKIPVDANELLILIKERHSILLRSRLTKNPGQFKSINNRAGRTEFVDWQLVSGTLRKGFEWYSMLVQPFARAAYMMFLISEVHSFLDGMEELQG